MTTRDNSPFSMAPPIPDSLNSDGALEPGGRTGGGLTRRHFLAAGATLVAGAALGSISRSVRAADPPFKGKTLRLFIYSGAWEKAINASFIPKFEAMTGAKVIPDPGWWDSIPKLKASPPGQPAFDLVLTDPTQGYPAIKDGLFQTINMKNLPNLALLAPSVRQNWIVEKGYGVTFPDSMMTLAWNRKLVTKEPAGWGDLLRDDLRGKVGLYNSFYMSLYTFAVMKVTAAGKPGTAAKEMSDNLAGVLQYAKENRERVGYWWPTTTDMGLNLTQQNVGIGNIHSSGALPLLRQKGDIAAFVPDADRAAVQLMWVIPAGTKEKELAEAALNYLIGEEMQSALTANGNFSAVLSVAKKAAAADPAWGAVYPSTEQKFADIQYYPYDAYFKDWDHIVAIWDREILRKKA